jgi:GPH family glycoside/pentoside/hexuronide:cation symporter
MIFALQVLSSFAVGPIAPLFFAMFADVADHSEWTSRRQTTGLVFASALFAVKMGAALGSWVLGVVLSASGYVANSSQSTQSLNSILISMSILPGCLLAGSALAILTYSITDNVMKDVEIGLSTVR